MENQYKEMEEAVKNMPPELPFALTALTAAGHLYAAGYPVQEDSLSEKGIVGAANIFAPMLIWDEEAGETAGHLIFMWEVRCNLLMPIQEIANECNVSYRTIQRWRDERKIPSVQYEGKQVFPAEIVRDFAAQKGHIKGRIRWR